MPSKKGSGAQARNDLKKLSKLGLYKGDLRKRPTRYGLKKISEYRDVLSGKATIVTPKNPERFKNIFTVIGDKVIVPRRKGERISVDKKTREIVSKRKVGKRTVTARGMQLKRGQTPPKTEYKASYAVPLKSKGGGVDWHRFPERDELIKFMATYDFLGWQDYVVEESFDNPIDDDELDERFDNKRPGRRIKGGVKWTAQELATIRKDYEALQKWKKQRKPKRAVRRKNRRKR